MAPELDADSSLVRGFVTFGENWSFTGSVPYVDVPMARSVCSQHRKTWRDQNVSSSSHLQPSIKVFHSGPFSFANVSKGLFSRVGRGRFHARNSTQCEPAIALYGEQRIANRLHERKQIFFFWFLRLLRKVFYYKEFWARFFCGRLNRRLRFTTAEDAGMQRSCGNPMRGMRSAYAGRHH